MFDQSLTALIQVVVIDLVMAGDNAIIIGMAAAQMPKAQRGRVVFWGLAASVLLRVVLAAGAASILKVIGLTLAGGVLLLWVGWRFYRDLVQRHQQDKGAEVVAEAMESGAAAGSDGAANGQSVRGAVLRIAAADLSMSLDNVLAVAGAALNHLWVLVVGLLLSVVLMGFAASQIAKLLQKYPWLSYAGVLIVLYVALHMIWLGGVEVFHAASAP